MGTSELADFLEQNFSPKTYTELSANQNKSLIQSPKCEAYDFDEITEYIFPQNKPSSADAILLDKKEYTLSSSKVDSTEKCPEPILTVHSAGARK